MFKTVQKIDVNSKMYSKLFFLEMSFSKKLVGKTGLFFWNFVKIWLENLQFHYWLLLILENSSRPRPGLNEKLWPTSAYVICEWVPLAALWAAQCLTIQRIRHGHPCSINPRSPLVAYDWSKCPYRQEFGPIYSNTPEKLKINC